MIDAITMTGVKYELDEQIKRYVTKKIGRLDRYLPKHARKSATADVKLRQVNESHGNKYEVEVILHVPDERLTAKDSTMNMFAAVDIVEEKMKNLLRKYKEKHQGRARAGGGILGRFRRGGSESFAEPLPAED